MSRKVLIAAVLTVTALLVPYNGAWADHGHGGWGHGGWGHGGHWGGGNWGWGGYGIYAAPYTYGYYAPYAYSYYEPSYGYSSYGGHHHYAHRRVSYAYHRACSCSCCQ